MSVILREPKARPIKITYLDDGTAVYLESNRKKALYTPLPSGIKAHMRKEQREAEREKIREEREAKRAKLRKERAAARAREKAKTADQKRKWHPYVVQGGRRRA